MTIQRVAAFHEAGHAIAAHRSKFHTLVGPINLQQYGAGQIFVSLSKSKLQAAGKPATAASQTDKEVATDLAVVLCAGLVSERLAEEKAGLKANQDCAVPDHDLMKQQLVNAGLSACFDRHETSARQLLEFEWALVSSLADLLYKNVTTDPTDIIEFIKQHAQP
ncbi:hypothetical protein [Propionivibrio sp.]|uniref:hypothetical protein n=1 Tax=Propionivibrio sp. TaxID=2212460 RepID=UPI0025F92773|nr:hypothetical protein [Propionivibrio sp.]MBK7356383.1 hypothetical protein [Propionivibrio sp.]